MSPADWFRSRPVRSLLADPRRIRAEMRHGVNTLARQSVHRLSLTIVIPLSVETATLVDASVETARLRILLSWRRTVSHAAPSASRP
jgi:hypothetical protein